MQNTISSNTNINEAVKDRLKDSMDTISIATKAVDSVVKSIIKMTDNVNAKQLIGSNFKMKKISKLTSQYMGIVGEIINALIVPDNKQYNSISELAGYIKEKSTQVDSDGKPTKVDPEYRNLDSLLKIIGITNDIMKAIDSLSKSDITMKSFINFRVNLARTTKMMKIMVREIFKSLQSIANDPSIKKIMDVLVGDPEKVVETMIDNSKEENWDMKVDKDFDKGSKSIKDILQETTTIKQRKGIVDVIQGIFETLKLILELQLPHPLAFKLKMRRARLCYMNAFSAIKQMANEISANDGAKSIQLLGDILRGTGRNGDDGLVGTITNLYQILDMMGEMGKPALAKKLDRFSKDLIPSFKDIIINLTNIFTEDPTKKKIEELISGSTQKKIEKISEVINSIDSIISDLLKISAKLLIIVPIAILISLVSPFIRLYITTIKWFMKGLLSLVKYLEESKGDIKKISETLNDLNGAVKCLLITSGLLISLAILATPTVLAMVINSIFLLALWSFTLLLNVVLSSIENIIDRKFRKGLREFNTVLLNIMVIQYALIVMALVAAPTIAAIVINLLLIGALMVFIVTTGILFEIISKVLTTDTFIAMMELIGFLLIILVVAAIMMIFSVMVKPATNACFMGILFLVGLLVFVALLGVLGLLASYISVFIGTAIIGLLLICAMLTVVLVMAMMLVVLSKVFEMMSIGAILGALGIILLAIPMAVAAGVAGLSSIIAIPGMIMALTLLNIVLVVSIILLIIQKLNLDKGKITENITTIKDGINTTSTEISKIKILGLAKAFAIVTAAIPLVFELVILGRKLRKLQRFKLDREKVISNVQTIFDTVREIENQIKSFSGIINEDGKVDIKALAKNTLDNIVKGITTKKKMDRSDAVLVKVYSIAKKLNKIQNIKLEWDKIKNNLNVCFDTVDAIVAYVNGRDSAPKDDQDVVKEEINNANLSVFDKLKFKTKKKQLRKSDLILGKVYNIVKTLQDIEKIKIDEKTIVSKVSELLGVVESIDTEISNKLNISDAEKMTAVEKRAMRKALRFENKMKKLQAQNVDKMTVIISNVSEMIDIMKDLKTLEFDKDTVVKNAGIIFDAAEEIHQLIVKRFSDPVDDTNFNTVMSYVRLANKEITGLSKLTDKEVANTKNTLDYYTNFLTKVDGLKVENLKESAHLFEQMANFSKTIEGNFEKLADAVNEKLMPVLEELKDIMDGASDKLEKGFNSTNETLVATSPVPVSSNNMRNIVKAGNPTMTPDQVSAESNRRLESQMRSQNQTLVAKIEEMISLLSGQGKIRAILEY